jgi:hypothetical protein
LTLEIELENEIAAKDKMVQAGRVKQNYGNLEIAAQQSDPKNQALAMELSGTCKSSKFMSSFRCEHTRRKNKKISEHGSTDQGGGIAAG